MSNSATIYCRRTSRDIILNHYRTLLDTLKSPYSEKELKTSYGEVHCILAGVQSGETIFFFPGSRSLTPQSLSLLKPLMEKYRIIALDLPGFPGFSAEQSLSLENDQFALWFKEILQFFELDTAHTIGYSYGAAVIISIAKHNPDLLLSASLLMPAGLGSRNTLSLIFRLYIPLLLYKIIPIPPFRYLFLSPLFAGKIKKEWGETLGLVIRNVKAKMKLPEPVYWEDIEVFKKPVLLLAGDKDFLFPARLVKAEAAFVFPNLKRTVILENCGHIPAQKELIETISEEISLFLQEYSSTS